MRDVTGGTLILRRVAIVLASIGLALVPLAKPSSAQLANEIAAGAKATKMPDLAKTVPPLASLKPEVDGTMLGYNKSCYTTFKTAVPPHAASLCAWGDLKSAKTLLVVGDSQAAMWLVSIVPVAKSLGWKVVSLEHTGCPPWPNQSSLDHNGGDESGCVAWDRSILAFEKTLRPKAVLAIGDGLHVGKGRWFTVAQMKADELAFVKDVAPAKVIFLSPIPMYLFDHLTYTPSECLAARTSLRACDFSPAQLIDPVFTAATAAAAKASHQPEIVVTRYFCTKTICPVVVANHLVYLDGAHANRYWMDWISTAFGKTLGADL
jgi:hypothetical protein